MFRAKRLDNGEWVEGFYVCLNGTEHMIYNGYAETDCGEFYADYFQVDPETVCQFTGLTDKNGKKIFEGDICKHRSNYSGDFIISVVTFTDGQFLVMADNNSGFNLSEKLEVIGNIHDNPELMEGGEADETD